MNWSELFNRDNMPDLEQVGAYIQSPLWEQLNHVLTEQYAARPKLEYSGCSMPGWNIKYKKKGKTICTVYPDTDKFTALVIANECNQVELDYVIQTCQKPLQESYRNTNYMNGGKWLFVTVDTMSALDDVMKLVEIRAK